MQPVAGFPLFVYADPGALVIGLCCVPAIVAAPITLSLSFGHHRHRERESLSRHQKKREKCIIHDHGNIGSAAVLLLMTMHCRV